MTEQKWENQRYGLWQRDGQNGGKYYSGTVALVELVKWATDKIKDGKTHAYLNMDKNSKKTEDKQPDLYVTLKPFTQVSKTAPAKEEKKGLNLSDIPF